MQEINKYFSKTVMVFGLLLVLSFLTFGNNLRGEFMIDDFGLTIENNSPEGTKLSNFYQHFVPNNKVVHNIENAPRSVYYRPLAHILPFLQYLIFGYDTFGYHVTNLILFALACFCFYLLFAEISGDKRFALICAILFCLHPLNGFTVNYITASVYALQLVFLSLCVLFHMRWQKSDFHGLLFLSLSLLAFVGALLCHETSLMIPAYLFLITWHRQKSVIKVFMKTIPALIIAIVYISLRFYFTSIQESVVTKAGVYADLNFVNYIGTFTKLFVWYFEKFITLQGMVIIWSTPLVKDFLWVWFIGFAITIGLLISLLMKWRNDIKQIFLLWFVLGLPPIVFGCMFLPQTGLMIEPHWLFFASFGLFALFATALLALAKRVSPVLRIGGFVLVMAILLITSWKNNLLWKDELTFTRHWVAMAPTNKNAAFCLGHALLTRGHFSEAREWFLKALMNDRNDWQIYTNLAAISLKEKNEAQALDYFQKSLMIFPQSAVTHNNLGNYYLQKQDYVKAQEYLRKANTFNPYLVEVLLNLGLIAEFNKNWLQSLEYYWRAFDLRPNDARVIYALGRGYANTGHIKEAIYICETGLRLYPSDENIRGLLSALKTSVR
ncbi:MAG: hypothetical protein H6754_02705 [Candidatus Omnitrophica bacterium]|nr:hypothetical protein [Candidatus Omnitrophota bacterium]